MASIEHFAIYAADAPALKDFYVDAFGMKVLVENPGPPPGYFLGDDRGSSIEIIGRPDGHTNANQRWVTTSPSRSTTCAARAWKPAASNSRRTPWSTATR
ncbi:MAG: VOC family protein [Isosphaeraceae bacterium]